MDLREKGLFKQFQPQDPDIHLIDYFLLKKIKNSLEYQEKRRSSWPVFTWKRQAQRAGAISRVYGNNDNGGVAYALGILTVRGVVDGCLVMGSYR